MKTEQPVTRTGGIGFFGLLTIVFITLKLCKVIDWSWWWVLAPAWGLLALVLVIVTAAAIIAGFVVIFTSRK